MMTDAARPSLLLPSGATISAAGWLGTPGVAGLWSAAGGAGVEWVRGRTYGGGYRR